MQPHAAHIARLRCTRTLCRPHLLAHNDQLEQHRRELGAYVAPKRRVPSKPHGCAPPQRRRRWLVRSPLCRGPLRRHPAAPTASVHWYGLCPRHSLAASVGGRVRALRVDHRCERRRPASCICAQRDMSARAIEKEAPEELIPVLSLLLVPRRRGPSGAGLPSPSPMPA